MATWMGGGSEFEHRPAYNDGAISMTLDVGELV